MQRKTPGPRRRLLRAGKHTRDAAGDACAIATCHLACTGLKRHGSKTAPACSSLSAPKRQQDAKMVTTHLKKCKLEFNHPTPFPNQHFENTMLILHWFGNTSKTHPLRGRRDNAVTTWGCAQSHCICNTTTTPTKLVTT